jgi:predicted TIM-barrel fold metal-dependent hydrolase
VMSNLYFCGCDCENLVFYGPGCHQGHPMNQHQMHSPNASRRDLLRGLAATLPMTLLAQPRKRGRIDVHHHMLPPFQPNMAERQYAPQASLDAMDKFGTEQAILSLTIAGEYLYDGSEKANKFARETNEYGAKAMQLNPRRLGFFAALPGRNIDASLKEIEYSFDTLKCDGVALFTNLGDKWWGDPTFVPIFDELNRRKSAVVFHPTVANCCHNLAGLGDGVVEFDFDTTRTVVSLLYNGVLARCQDIRWIVNHSGAAIPALAGRIKDRVPGHTTNSSGPVNAIVGKSTEGQGEKTPNGVYAELKRLYYECAHAAYPMPIAALRAFAPPTQFLFGTDFPIEPMESTVRQIPGLRLPSNVQYALDRGNAERLWPRFKM